MDYSDPTTLIDATKINPYLATLSPKCKDVDCSEMKDHGIVGLMLYGGCYYDDVHLVKRYYRADNLKNQVKSATQADLPYALYVDVRAKNTEEAKLECTQLWYLVSNYPPKLGIWLRLRTTANKLTLDRILEVYYEYIYRWGMAGNCGIYATRDDMTLFTWDNFYERFALWLVDHVESMGEVDGKLLTPEFFMLGEV